VAGENASISVTSACGSKLTATAAGGKNRCPACGATYEFAVPVTALLNAAAAADHEPALQQTAAVPSVLPYRTPPSLNADPRTTRWRIAGKSTKRATCHKCGTAYRYEVTRDVRSWSVRTVFGVSAVVILLGLSCLYPAVFVGATALLLLSVRFWVRIVIIMVRSFGGEGGSLKVGGDFASANRRLRKELDAAVEPVPCPECGWYQPEMVREARARSFAWTNWIVLGLVILAPAAWFANGMYGFIGRIPILDIDGSDPVAAAGVLAVVTLVTIGLTLILRWALSLTVDPNSPAPGLPPMFPDAPLAITEAEWTQKMAAQTTRITATRQARPAMTTAGTRRIVPPRSAT